MDFASPYAYVGASNEEVDEAELNESLSAVEEKDNNKKKKEAQADAAPRGAPPISAMSPSPAIQPPSRRLRRQADTNVVVVKFASLASDAAEFFAGDPCSCGGCSAVMSSTSKVVKCSEAALAAAQHPNPAVAPVVAGAGSGGKEAAADRAPKNAPPVMQVHPEEDGYVWECEFCGHVNQFPELVAEEIPKADVDSRDYVLDASAAGGAADEHKQGQGYGPADEMVIFCVDVSGSMCSTTEVPGNFQLKGAPRFDASAFDLPAEAGFVNAPQQHAAGTSWVSRLRCVQAAVEQQIQSWKKDHPQKRVGVVTFNREVTILGDGTMAPEVVAGDKLYNQEQLQAIGAKHTVTKPIRDTCDELSKKVWALEEGGATALGPALLVAVSMAQQVRGSRVVVCTDGLANVGLGAMDKASCPTDELRQAAEVWYESVANVAKLAGVGVSVISIKGEECALEDLGRVADITGGQVTRVDPLEIDKNFASLLENPVIASQVTATFIIHKGLMFRNEPNDTNRIRREVGNVTADTELTFEYGVRSSEELACFQHLKSLPFQVQIHFTKPSGMKCLRVLSKTQLVTNKQEEAERDVRIDLLAANASQQAARLAERGDLQAARINNLVHARVMHRSLANGAGDNEMNAVMFKHWRSEAESYQSSLAVQQAQVESMVPQLKAMPQAAPLGKASSPFGDDAPAPSPSHAISIARAAKAVRRDADFEQQHQLKNRSSAYYASKAPPKK